MLFVQFVLTYVSSCTQDWHYMVDVYVLIASVFIPHYKNMYFYLLRLNALICYKII